MMDATAESRNSAALVNVQNPMTGESIASFRELSDQELQIRIESARQAQPDWAALNLDERKRYIAKMRAWLVENAESVAQTVSDCVGKTPIEALAGDVMPSVLGSSWYQKHAKAALKPTKLSPGTVLFFNKRSTIHHKPHGVVGIISPWNYPLGIPMHEIVPALLAGNTVLLKTAPETLPVGECIQEMCDAAGLPKDVFQHVIVDGPACGDVMLSRTGVNKLFFTGSVRVGKILAEKAAKNLIPISLELGGKDAMIVLDDANIERAALGAVWAGMQNAGQSCAGVERLYVHESIHDEFLQEMKRVVDRMRWTERTPHENDIGALCTDRQVETVKSQLDAALQSGATIFAEASFTPSSEHVLKPMLLTNVNHEMDIMREETFGPVIGVMPFSTDEEAIHLANDSPYALTGSVWSRNTARAKAMALKIRAGAVTINDHLLSHGITETPWGGPGDSGIGRGHGHFAFEEVTQPQVVINDWLGFAKKNVFWYPYTRAVYDGMLGAIRAFHGRGPGRRLAGLVKFLKIVPRMFRKD